MKSSTYKWIIGCLLGLIVLLTTFLILKEMDVIYVSFSDSISIAATLSSLILSIIAMFYTYYSGRDALQLYNQIQNTIIQINSQVSTVSEETRKNSSILERIKEGLSCVEGAINSSALALESMNKETISDKEKETVINSIEDTKKSMMMFLSKMMENERS